MTIEVTPREFDVWQMTAAGHGTKEIAETLGVCRDTIWRYRQNVMGKLYVDSDVKLALAAVACGVIKVAPAPSGIVVKSRRWSRFTRRHAMATGRES